MRTYVRLPAATILHADLDAFFASVEQRDDPRLRERPVIVGGGVVLAASYEAKAYGVKTAMGGRQARRLCPQAYRAAADVRLLRGEQGRVRSVRGHHAARRGALHRRGVPRRSRARTTRRPAAARSPLACGERILAEVGLPITVGIARTKFLAKVASAVAKPNGLLVVPPRRARLPSSSARRAAVGLGRATAGKLHDRGLRTVGQVAALDEVLLVALLGQASGRHLHALAHNRDPRPVRTGRRRRSIGSQRALGRGASPSRRSTRRSSRSSIASRGGCAPAGDGVAPSSSASASTTSRGRRGRSRCLD